MIFNFDSMKLRDVILGFCMLAVMACEEDYSGYVYVPFEEVERLFEEKYAGAEAVLWRNRGKYDEVFFVWQGNSCEGWFSKKQSWVMTETKLNENDVPPEVMEAAGKGRYAGWVREEEWTKIEQPSLVTLYGVKVIKQTACRWIWYTANGQLFREIAEKVYINGILSEMPAFVEARYGWAWVMDAGKIAGNGPYMVFLHEDRLKTIVFTAAFDWKYTSWLVDESVLSEGIKQVLQENFPKGFSVDWVEYREEDRGNYYIFALSSRDGEKRVIRISSGGKIENERR